MKRELLGLRVFVVERKAGMVLVVPAYLALAAEGHQQFEAFGNASVALKLCVAVLGVVELVPAPLGTVYALTALEWSMTDLAM